jgi:hypothetical protein
MHAQHQRVHLREACDATPEISGVITGVNLDQLFDERLAIQHAEKLVERLTQIG